MRYFFEISYHGKHYCGWQSQPNALGVQAVVEDALTKLLRQPMAIIGSGRTDAGVHCKQQFFHADIETSFNLNQLQYKLNSFLPRDIAIHGIRKVNDNANARFDAVDRSYCYFITRKKDPFSEGLKWHFFKDLNLQTMNAAAALLVGKQDFECFSKVNTDVNNFICDIKKAEWIENGSDLVFSITANRFLRGMVRAIVGTLVEVGTNNLTLEQFQQIIHGKDRQKAGANVPPHGLYLMKVTYPDSIYED